MVVKSISMHGYKIQSSVLFVDCFFIETMLYEEGGFWLLNMKKQSPNDDTFGTIHLYKPDDLGFVIYSLAQTSFLVKEEENWIKSRFEDPNHFNEWMSIYQYRSKCTLSEDEVFNSSVLYTLDGKFGVECSSTNIYGLQTSDLLFEDVHRLDDLMYCLSEFYNINSVREWLGWNSNGY